MVSSFVPYMESSWVPRKDMKLDIIFVLHFENICTTNDSQEYLTNRPANEKNTLQIYRTKYNLHRSSSLCLSIMAEDHYQDVGANTEIYSRQ